LSTSAPTTARPNGLATVADIIVAPASAFAKLREAPTWGWAFLVATVLGIIGSLIISPAVAHALQTTLPAQLAANPAIANLPADQQQVAINRALGFSKIIAQVSFVFVPIGILISGLVQGLIMLIANAVAHGDGTFKKYFALSVNVSVVGVGLSSLLIGIIVLVRGVNSFDSPTAIQGAVPSLALLAPGVRGALGGFLGSMNIVALWAIALLALGMNGVGRIPRLAAWVTAIVMLLLTACFAAWGAAQNH
jgi:hypothetical protein